MAGLTQEELLEAALAKAGGNKRRLSRETGLPYDYVLRWTAAAGTGMRADATIALLEYVGWLRVGEEAGPARGHTGGASETASPPGVPEWGVERARALDEAAETLERLAVSLRGLAPPRASSR